MSSLPKELDRRAVVGEAWSDARRVWRQLLAVDLFFKLLAFALLTPAVGLALRAGVAASGSPVLADMEILFFALRPLGLLVLVAVAALSVAIVALEQACLMAIGMAAAEGVRLDLAQVMRFAASRVRPVIGLAARLVGRVLLLAAPFLGALALVYFGLLREFDINYYLRERPAAFVQAIVLAALLLAGMAWVLIPRLVAWSLALPLVLFQGCPPGRALAESAGRTASHRRSISVLLVAWGVGAAVLSMLLPGLLFALGRVIAPFGMGNVRWVLGFMLLLGALWLVVHLLVSWAGAAAFALLLTRLFRRLGGTSHGELRLRFANAGLLTSARGPQVTLGRAVGAVAVLSLLAAGLGVYLLRGVRGHGPVVVIAHRGAAADAPENTLAAIERALVDGADYVEIDVQETADDEIVVLHDSDLMKVSSVNLKIWDATLERLAGIDIGSWFGAQFGSERVPLLREVLERARGRARVVIELKYYGHDEDLEPRVIDLVERHSSAGDVALMSLEYDAVRKIRALRPDWTVGLLTAKAVGDLTMLDADFLAVNAGIANRAFVRRAHAQGREVYVWTINDPVQMFRMLNLGVDGLITDRPAVARWVIDRRSRMSTAERLLVGLAFFFGATAPDPPASVDAP